MRDLGDKWVACSPRQVECSCQTTKPACRQVYILQYAQKTMWQGTILKWHLSCLISFAAFFTFLMFDPFVVVCATGWVAKTWNILHYAQTTQASSFKPVVLLCIVYCYHFVLFSGVDLCWWSHRWKGKLAGFILSITPEMIAMKCVGLIENKWPWFKVAVLHPHPCHYQDCLNLQRRVVCVYVQSNRELLMPCTRAAIMSLSLFRVACVWRLARKIVAGKSGLAQFVMWFLQAMQRVAQENLFALWEVCHAVLGLRVCTCLTEVTM